MKFSIFLLDRSLWQSVFLRLYMKNKKAKWSTACPKCDETVGQLRNGKNKSGSTRMICKLCGRNYTLDPRTRGYDREMVRKVLATYLSLRIHSPHIDATQQFSIFFNPKEERVCRTVARQHGVNHQTVINWVRSWPQGWGLSDYLRRFPSGRK